MVSDSSISTITVKATTVDIAVCNNTGKLTNLLVAKFNPYVVIVRSGNFQGCATVSFDKSLFTDGIDYWIWLRDGTTDLTVTNADGKVVSTHFTYKQMPKPGIYNICWNGTLGTGPCSSNFGPNIDPGKTIDIKVDVSNNGGVGPAMASFKINGVTKYSDTNTSLAASSATNLIPWSPIFKAFVMPSSDVKLEVDVSYQDSTGNWVQTDSQLVTIPITSSPPACTGITLDRYSAIINTGGKVTITATVTPGNVQYPVQFKDDKGTVLFTCNTTGAGTVDGGSTCSYTYTAGPDSGTVYITAYTDSCMSTRMVVTINQPIYQYNLNITILDKVSGSPVQGATVLGNTVGSAPQSQTTDVKGNVSFRLDSGTINVAISKNNYNTDNEVLSLYQDTSKIFYLTPTPPTPTVGGINFVSVPVGASIYIDGTDTKQVTPYSIGNLKAGGHTWSLKLSGYNDLNGSVTVPSGGSTDVYVSLSPSTPTSGSLNITSTPMGAEVWIDGKDYNVQSSGATTINNIPPGKHTLKLTMSGYQDYTLTFTITAGQTTFLNPSLIHLATIGALEISSDPSGARIYLDDLDTGYVTPATIVDQKQGSHSYKVVLSGYKDVQGKFDITAGQTTIVHLVLEKTEGLGNVATILGIAAAGVAVLAFLEHKKE